MSFRNTLFGLTCSAVPGIHHICDISPILLSCKKKKLDFCSVRIGSDINRRQVIFGSLFIKLLEKLVIADSLRHVVFGKSTGNLLVGPTSNLINTFIILCYYLIFNSIKWMTYLFWSHTNTIIGFIVFVLRNYAFQKCKIDNSECQNVLNLLIGAYPHPKTNMSRW
jgi:hypothetical protein